MGALAYIKDYVAKHNSTAWQTQNNSKVLLKEEKFPVGCLGEFLEEDFSSEKQEEFSCAEAPESNVHHWRPGSVDDIPYE